MILYFQAPPQRPEKEAAVFPLQDLQSPATTKPISCLRTLGNKHIKQVGKGRGSNLGRSRLASCQAL